MRKVSKKQFWKTVSEKERGKEVFELFKKLERTKPGSMDELRAFALGQVIPAYQSAVTLLGCLRPDDIAAYFTKWFELAEEMSGGSLEWFMSQDADSKEVRARVSNISRSFALRRRCHVTYREFVCYCDERVNQ